MVCKYHGLSFHADGSFKATAAANWFCETHAYDELDTLRVKSFRTKQVGEFVFVSLGNTVAFEDQFNDEMIREMAKLKFEKNYGHARWEEDFNWKLNYENIKDPLHIYYVHPKSFSPMMQFEAQSYIKDATKKRLPETASLPGSPLNAEPNQSQPSLKDMSFVAFSPKMNKPEVWWKPSIQEQYRDGSYVNFYFFPSTNFYAVGGDHFARQTYDPTGPRAFRYTLEVYLPQLKRKFNLAPLVKRLMEIEKSVIDEDSVILKQINDSFESPIGTKLQHGDYEKQIPRQIRFMRNAIYKEKSDE